ncbi:sulfotransferase domain-containing protein [Nocardioides sp. GXQ0305]|uniref:sulfotransferase domain-containing protein n=1 Tax=Nocardioides sp. GXQ0305 TaxID=3423912 RepID=UPI003D7C9527
MLPGFILIGAMKSGTTSLSAYLWEHPDIFFCKPREPRFFSDHYDDGLAAYERLFDDALPGQVCGEGSTNYSVAALHPGVPERIAAACPDVKILYLLREPVARIRSLYQHRLDRKPDLRSIDQAVFEQPIYLESARYGAQLDAYLDHFDRDQVLVLSSDRLREDRSSLLAEVYGFLGVDPGFTPADLDEMHNPGDAHRRMPGPLAAVRGTLARTQVLERIPVSAKHTLRSWTMRPQRPTQTEVSPELRERIHEALHPDLQRLRTIVGPSFDLWGLA